jgi:Co/Zn/Cd efflux system component
MIAKLRKVVIVVAILNLAYFGVEFAMALSIGSVSLFADSVDFLEDASINLLIAVALGWTATGRARLGMALAGVLLVPGLATLWTAWGKFLAPTPPAPLPNVDRSGCLGDQFDMRLHVGAFPGAQRQSDTSGVSLSS